MLRIRLSRVGKKNKAQFRVTVADARRAPTGKFIEILGHYNPHTKEKVLKKERVEYWISKGAKPSATIHNFLVDAGIIKGEKVVSWKPKKKAKSEKEEGKAENKAEVENEIIEEKTAEPENKIEEKKEIVEPKKEEQEKSKDETEEKKVIEPDKEDKNKVEEKA